jgi:branched-chain amino acid transport system substrate-binding protein
MKLRIFSKYNFAIILIIFSALLFTGCAEKEIKVGFAGPLTGRISDMGVSARNGVMLAVDEINKRGGINGSKIKLLVKDDKHDNYIAKEVDKELIKNDVVAIIGHMTSEMSAAALSIINKEEVLMISPVSSSNVLSGLDDYFLRVYPSHEKENSLLSYYAYKNLNIRNISVIYDLSNRSFTKNFYEDFKLKFEKMGGSIAKNISFISGSNISMESLVNEINYSESDGVLILAGTIDTALICQQLKKKRSDIPIMASGWAMTNEILKYGGQSIEGVIFPQVVDKTCDKKTYEEFKEKYYNRYKKQPNFGAVLGYETAQVLFEGISLSANLNSREIKKAILKKESFNGLQEKFKINGFGDAFREYHLFVVEEGKFKRLK